MRAIDVWVIFCYIGVFSALMEYCVILYLTKTAIFDQKSTQVKDKELICLNQEQEKENPTETLKERQEDYRLKYARIIERAARISLIVYNISFPLCYFIICLSFS